MQQLKPGSKLNNKYRILRFIGQGGFAFAYEAVQEPIGLKVCIKELFIKESRDTFLREGRILATLKSDSIVKVLDYFEENETSYIVLEYLEGITLKECKAIWTNSGRPAFFCDSSNPVGAFPDT